MTESNTHTPGPWEAQDSGLIYAPPPDSENESILICDVGEIDETTPDRTANARLIAAAPQLLEGAEDLLGMLSSLADDYAICRELVEEAKELRAAIAQAKG